MKGRIFTTAAVVAVVLGAGSLYLYFRPLSPGGHTRLTTGDLTVSVLYSRPSVRGRLIFGTSAQDALVPYGIYWRLGANDATEIKFSRPVNFNGQPVEAGSYRMYAVPDAEKFEIVLNSELGKSGAEEPDHSLDLLQTEVAVEKMSSPIERFIIRMEKSDQGIDVICEWSDVRIVIPVTDQ